MIVAVLIYANLAPLAFVLYTARQNRRFRAEVMAVLNEIRARISQLETSVSDLDRRITALEERKRLKLVA